MSSNLVGCTIFFLPFSPQNPGSEAFLLFAAESCKMVQIE